MKDIFATIGKIGGLIFAAAVIGFTSWMTLNLAGRLIPGNTILQAMVLVLFDVGAFVWFVQFLTQARGTVQWAIAGIGFVVGIVGTVIMTAGELVLGQSLVVLDDPTKLGWILVSTVIVAALAHAVLIYAFHLVEPATLNRIENAQEVAKAVGKAYKDTRGEIERNSDELTAALRASVLFEAQQQIASATAAHIRGAGLLASKAGEAMRGGVVIPGQARDLDRPQAAILTDNQAPARLPWWRKVRKPSKPSATSEPSKPAPAPDPALVAALVAAVTAAMQPAPAGIYASDAAANVPAKYAPVPCPSCGKDYHPLDDFCPHCSADNPRKADRPNGQGGQQ